MSNARFTIWTGTTPEGSEVVGTEKFWNEQGYKETYEYLYIPNELIQVDEGEIVWELPEGSTHEQVMALAAEAVEALSWESSAPAGMQRVYMVNTQAGESFSCRTFQNFQATLDSLV